LDAFCHGWQTQGKFAKEKGDETSGSGEDETN
jgi:hypothetical protein